MFILIILVITQHTYKQSVRTYSVAKVVIISHVPLGEMQSVLQQLDVNCSTFCIVGGCCNHASAKDRVSDKSTA